MTLGRLSPLVRRADWFRSLPLAAIVGLAVSCGAPPTTPIVTTLTVTAVTPSSLSTTGGATVTITGTGFGTDTTVTIGGTAVSGATVTSTSITATAPSHAGGSSAVVIASGGKSASSAITFVAPSGVNAAPAISNLRVTGPGSKPPSPFVDLASGVTLSATVTDVETSPSSLTYVWTVAAGTISGTGASVTWNLPALLAVTPSAVTATLTVTETFTESGVQHRNIATSSLLADAHDSSTEILDKGFRFLDLFSQSSVPPATVMSDFATTCDGYAGELQDTVDIRNNYLHLSYSITRLPAVEFKYGQSCVWPEGRGIVRADACSIFRAHWVVRALRDVPDDGVVAGEIATSDGRDLIGNIFQNGQWKLCSSTWLADQSNTTVMSTSGVSRTIKTPQGMVPGRIKRQ